MVLDYPQMLRSSGLRVTAARLAVLKFLEKHPHSDADMVRADVESQLGAVSGQAVYDALNGLSSVGILRRVAPAGSRACYEINMGDNHHHMVCRKCQKMLDIPCATGAAPCLDPCEHHGFLIDEAEVIYWGYCPECAKEQGLTVQHSVG